MAAPILILGSRGMVASAIAATAGVRAIRAARGPIASDTISFDALTEGLARILDGMTPPPKAVVIGFGISGTHTCASDPIGSRHLNIDRVLAAARTAAERGALPVLFSTDSVFDGSAVLWSEHDPTHPICEYGRQRAVVEETIARFRFPYLMMRLSRVIGDHAGRRDLLFQWCGLMRRGRRILLPTDQIFTPIAAADLGRIALALIDSEYRGLINVAGPERISSPDLFDLLCAACSRLGQKPQVELKRCRVADLPGLEQRPAVTMLNVDRLRREIDPRFTPLKETVNGVAVAAFAGGDKL